MSIRVISFYCTIFRLFLERAHQEGIEVAPLKGAHVLTSVYGHIDQRPTISDIDFLVRDKDWAKTLELLEQMGFRADTIDTRPASMRQYHEACYYRDLDGRGLGDADQPGAKPQGGLIIFEPHRQLAPLARLPIDYEQLWQRSIASTLDGAVCRRLSAEDHALHAIVHLCSHMYIRPQKTLTDLDLLIRRAGVNLQIVLERAAEWKCRRATWLALDLLNQSSPDLGLTKYIRQVEPPWPIRYALSKMVKWPDGFIYPNLGLRTRELMLWPLVFDGIVPFTRFTLYYLGLRSRDLANGRITRWSLKSRTSVARYASFESRRFSREPVAFTCYTTPSRAGALRVID